MEEQSRVYGEAIEPGEIVYDSAMRPIGRVSGLSEDGFEVEAIDLDGSEMAELPGQEFGKGYLMWRCIECGEMDELKDGLPEACPDCGAPPEAISVIEED